MVEKKIKGSLGLSRFSGLPEKSYSNTHLIASFPGHPG